VRLLSKKKRRKRSLSPLQTPDKKAFRDTIISSPAEGEKKTGGIHLIRERTQAGKKVREATVFRALGISILGIRGEEGSKKNEGESVIQKKKTRSCSRASHRSNQKAILNIKGRKRPIGRSPVIRPVRAEKRIIFQDQQKAKRVRKRAKITLPVTDRKLNTGAILLQGAKGRKGERENMRSKHAKGGDTNRGAIQQIWGLKKLGDMKHSPHNLPRHIRKQHSAVGERKKLFDEAFQGKK